MQRHGASGLATGWANNVRLIKKSIVVILSMMNMTYKQYFLQYQTDITGDTSRQEMLPYRQIKNGGGTIMKEIIETIRRNWENGSWQPTQAEFWAGADLLITEKPLDETAVVGLVWKSISG